MAKKVVIVESPAKVKTINKILGSSYKVVSSMGHLVDLPKSTLGVDIKNNFEPKFIAVRAKTKYLSQLKKDTADCDTIYFATDPDREGEAIGWNLKNELGEDKKIYRVSFQEITKEAVLKAFERPRAFDQKLVDAQIARRILDRIVGYKISPILWKKVGSRLSAGRVQSVALRIIVEREREINAFVPQEYWQITVDLKKKDFKGHLSANLEKIDGKKAEISNETEAKRIAEDLKTKEFVVTDLTVKQIRRNPSAPYTTSTLQQDAFNKLGFNANRTMMFAQQLYEGVDVAGETVGLITYMRTDSVNIAQEALGRVRSFIKEQYGEKFLPKESNVYKSKKSAQEAHEAVRPTNVNLKPSDLQDTLEPSQLKLYTLIWNRFVASQMEQAVLENKKLEITAGPYQFGSSASTVLFEGFLVLDKEAREKEVSLDFSHFKKDDRLKLSAVKPTQHFTKPPPRFTDASLVKALEEDGIGRPSTYASIIQTLVLRNYVGREARSFKPTDLGILICDMLVEYFKKVMDVGFTARMEEELDEVEEGKIEYHELLKEFYDPFAKELEFALSNMEKTEQTTDRLCPGGFNMIVKWGRMGRFISCPKFPECKYSEAYPMGIACSTFECVGGGEIVERQTRGGKKFYGCSKYPDCKYITNTLPPKNTEMCGGERVKDIKASQRPEDRYPACVHLKK